MPTRSVPVAIVKGMGDLGTGVAYRLWRAGFRVLGIDLPRPTVIRRSVAFATALYDGRITVEGAQAERIHFVDEAIYVWGHRGIPVLADPEARAVSALGPEVLVDATLAKRNTGTHLDDAPVVIACGPGFTVGSDCHAIVETLRGHDLGRVLWQGSAAPNTGVPGEVGGESARRIVRAPEAGMVIGRRAIGDVVAVGDVVAEIVPEGQGAARHTARHVEVTAGLAGVLRGLIHDGVIATAGMKIGDIDPRARPEYCFTISDKALAVGGGVVEAALALRSSYAGRLA
ncbi:MAG: EF2563 family selenium-dependent molybdenum hydroxylase system protein [Thermoflexales bacterium]|nr:EF2563 family selenium-dependent molybdenum hydroxylase system protein [Thermoflexales bacterium]